MNGAQRLRLAGFRRFAFDIGTEVCLPLRVVQRRRAVREDRQLVEDSLFLFAADVLFILFLVRNVGVWIDVFGHDGRFQF